MNLQDELKKELKERHTEFAALAQNLVESNIVNPTQLQRQFVLDCVLAGAGVAIGGLASFLAKMKGKGVTISPEEAEKIRQQKKI